MIIIEFINKIHILNIMIRYLYQFQRAILRFKEAQRAEMTLNCLLETFGGVMEPELINEVD